jgi:transcriptional regulator with XRE-family HTH domain
MSPESLPVKLRQARGTMSLARAAELSGVSEARIRLYEEGKRQPYGKTMRRLADTYGVPAAELFQQISDPWRSVTKKIFTEGILTPEAPARKPEARPEQRGWWRPLVADLLGQLVPPRAIPDLRPQLPSHRLGHVIAMLAQPASLLSGLEAPRLGHEVAVLVFREMGDLVEVHRHGAPPSPVVRHDPADPVSLPGVGPPAAGLPVR